jgi:hypothetical protein
MTLPSGQDVGTEVSQAVRDGFVPDKARAADHSPGRLIAVCCIVH